MDWPPFRIFGHRGSSARAPENTIESFARALDDGADALETDVHVTSDGHFVVSHDPDGRRTAGVPDRIADSPLADVRRWDAGAGFTAPDGSHPFAGAGYRVPTLDELLETFPGVPVSVDVKPDTPAVVPALLALVAHFHAADRVTLASFHPRVTRTVRRLGYPGPTALTQPQVAMVKTVPMLAALVRTRWRGQAAQIPRTGAGLRLDSPRFIRRCRALGVRADYWVVNDPDDAVTLLRRGATGVMTDVPARIADAVRARRTAPAEPAVAQRNTLPRRPVAPDDPERNDRRDRSARQTED